MRYAQSSQSRTRKTTPRRMCPPPPRGSWVDHPQPGTPRRSRSDKATAFAAAQGRRQHHLRYLAALTLRRTLASERDFSQARLQRKAFVSLDHLPPTSPAITTIRTRPFRPEARVCVLLAKRCHLLCPRSCGESRSRAKLTPTWRRGPTGYTRKETTLPPQLRAFCHPWRRARRPNPGLGRKCVQQHSPTANPLRLKTPVEHAALWWPKGPRCGHKSNGGQKEAKACGEGPPGMVPSPFSRRGELAML